MVLGLIGNVFGNLDQDAFVQGAENESKLQALQRANQNRINRDFFRDQQGGPPAIETPAALNQGMAGLNIDNFGGTYIDVPPPPVVTTEESLVDSPEEPVSDSTGIDTPVVKDPLKPTDPVIIDEPDLGFPKVDPNKIELPPAPKGRNQTNPERSAEIVRRQTIDSNTNAILKQFGIRRKAGQGSKSVTKEQGDAYNFYTSKEFKDFIYQYPQYLTDVSEDPFGFMKKYMGEKQDRTTSTVIGQTTDRTKKLISGRISAIDTNDILNSNNSKKLVELANSMGVDPIAALAIFGIESDFGRNAKKSARAAFGSMQVTNAQFNNLKKWFADGANRSKLEAIYPNNPAMVDKVIAMVAKMKRAGARSTVAGNEGELVAGLAQLVYNKAIGLPKNLWGAGYQGNADKVRDNRAPLKVTDGNISNSDYNTAYITLYNHIAGKMGQTTMTTSTTAAANQNAQTTTSSAAANNQAAGQKSGLEAITELEQENKNQIAGLKVEDARTDTAGQSTNTGNTGVASGDVSSLQIQSGVDTGGAKTGETVPKADPVVQPPAFYQSDPSKLGFDLRNYLEERALIINQTNQNVQVLAQRSDYFRRLAEVSRIGGTDEASYNQLINQSTELMAKAQTMQQAGALEAKKAENKIMYLQGMQGLQDLANGSVNRAAMVWSQYSGMDVRINPRSDGKYDITLNGKPYKTMDFQQLSNTLQLAFDQGYRKSQQAAATTRALKTFEAQLEITKENRKAYNERQKAVLESKLEIYKEMAKQSDNVELKNIDGVPYVVRGKDVFILEVFTETDLNGNTVDVVREMPVQRPEGSASSNAYKRK